MIRCHPSEDIATISLDRSLTPVNGLLLHPPQVGNTVHVLGYPPIPLASGPALVMHAGEVSNQSVALLSGESAFLYSRSPDPAIAEGPLCRVTGISWAWPPGILRWSGRVRSLRRITPGRCDHHRRGAGGLGTRRSNRFRAVGIGRFTNPRPHGRGAEGRRWPCRRRISWVDARHRARAGTSSVGAWQAPRNPGRGERHGASPWPRRRSGRRSRRPSAPDAARAGRFWRRRPRPCCGWCAPGPPRRLGGLLRINGTRCSSAPSSARATPSTAAGPGRPRATARDKDA